MMSTTVPKPATTPIPVQLSEPEFEAFILPHLSMPKRGPKCKLGYYRVFNADFRRLKFTHNGAHVLDGVPGTRKLQCEVFFPLPLGIAESHCIRLPGSSARPLEAMMR